MSVLVDSATLSGEVTSPWGFAVTITDGARAPHSPKVVDAIFNKKYTVVLEKRDYNGAELKASAIAQAVPIKPTDVLFELKNKNKREIIGDSDVVKVHEGLEFAAVADDDNS